MIFDDIDFGNFDFSKYKNDLNIYNYTSKLYCESSLEKDKKYLKIAADIAEWSKDPDRKVGAIIVGLKGQIVSQGFNGFPRGFDDSLERFKNKIQKRKYIIHAEANAIFNALYSGVSVENCTVYIHGLPPCAECAKALVQSGISRVVTDSKPISKNWQQSNEDALDIFKEADVEFNYVKD